MKDTPESLNTEWDAKARGQELLSMFKRLTGCPADMTLQAYSQLSDEEKQQLHAGDTETS